jgi:hypothetical protein
LKRESALEVGIFLATDLGLDLGKKGVQRFGRRDRSLQGAPFPESDYVLRRILETNAVGSAVRVSTTPRRPP